MKRSIGRRRPRQGHLAAALVVAFAPFETHADVPRPAAVFSYTEHCEVGNEAFRFAIAALGASHPASRGERSQLARFAALADSGCASRRGNGHSYGDLIARVDAANSPLDYYVGVVNPAAAQPSVADVIPWHVIDALFADPMTRFHAMSGNDDHFGDRATFAFRFWHQKAIGASASGRLGEALVLGSFADHYLQDHLAPGHLWTPRRDLHDMPSLGIHDHYNRRGHYYFPDRVEALLRLLPVSADTALPGPCGGRLASVCLRAVVDTGFIIRGDDLLDVHPLQRVYLTLLNARSILDVLEAYQSGSASEADSFSDVGWIGYRRLQGSGGSEHWAAPIARTPFGSYGRECGTGLPQIDRMPLVGVGIHAVPEWSNRRVAVSVERLMNGWPGPWLLDQDSTGQYQPVHGHQFGFLLGADLVVDGRHPGLGPRARLIVPLKRLNLQLSAERGVRWYPTAEAPNVGKQVGMYDIGRVEAGFGLLFLGIGAGMDRVVDRHDRLRRRFVVVSTVSAMVPRRSHRLLTPPRAIRVTDWPDGPHRCS